MAIIITGRVHLAFGRAQTKKSQREAGFKITPVY